MKYIKQIVDFYLSNALSMDAIICVIILIANTYLSLFLIDFNEKSNNINIINNIVKTSVSLAGFILTSLTIIIAIRSNVKIKKPKKAKTPLELFFSGGTYLTIIKVFKSAIIELIFCFIIAYIIWVLSANITNANIFKTIVVLIYLMAMSTIRCLFILFLLIPKKNK